MRKIVLLMLLAFFSNNAISQNEQTIITAFKQGNKGNCASVALIKASIDVFGVNKVFKDSIDTNSVHHITLKDCSTLTLTESEINMAEESCGFVLLDSTNSNKIAIYEYAILCYAVIAKKAQQIGDDNKLSFSNYSDAIEAVNNGLDTKISYKYLGLCRNVKHLTRWVSKVNDKKGVVAWTPKHTVFVSNGYYDKNGKAKKFKIIYRKRFQITEKTTL